MKSKTPFHESFLKRVKDLKIVKGAFLVKQRKNRYKLLVSLLPKDSKAFHTWLMKLKVTYEEKDKTRIVIYFPKEEHKFKIYLCSEEEVGSSLFFLRSPKEHTLSVQSILEKDSIFFNRHGMWKNQTRVFAPQTEREIYEFIELPYHPKHLRNSEIYTKIPKHLLKPKKKKQLSLNFNQK